MKGIIEVSPWAYILLAGAVLLLPFDVLTAALSAAAVHELFHIWILFLCKVPVFRIYIGAGGARIYTGNMTAVQEVLCAAAGPVGSLLLMLFADIFPLVSFFGLVQGVFNLLPLYPFDGGRILWNGLNILLPKSGNRYIGRIICGAIWLLLGLLLFWVSARLAFYAAAFLIIQSTLRKIPCKDGRLRVQ